MSSDQEGAQHLKVQAGFTQPAFAGSRSPRRGTSQPASSLAGPVLFMFMGALLHLCTATLTLAQEGEEIILPRQMGAINDYAAVLGNARQNLEDSLETIKQDFDVQVVVLATIFDPLDNPRIYTQKIWDFWKLSGRTVLLVFVKEQTQNQWVFELRVGEELRPDFQADHLERLRRGLAHHLERKRIKTAIEEAVTALHAMLDGSYGHPPPSAPAIGIAWVLLIVGSLLGLGGMVLGLRVFLKSRCPRCGARLRSYRTTSSRRGSRIEYRSCPRCGYARMR